MNPLKRELILYLILLAAFSPPLYPCHFCPHSTPVLHPSFSLLFLPRLLFINPSFLGEVSAKVLLEQQKKRQGRTRLPGMILCVCVCVYLNVGQVEGVKMKSADCVGCSFSSVFFFLVKGPDSCSLISRVVKSHLC